MLWWLQSPSFPPCPAAPGVTLHPAGQLEVALNPQRFTPLSSHSSERRSHAGMYQNCPEISPGRAHRGGKGNIWCDLMDTLIGIYGLPRETSAGGVLPPLTEEVFLSKDGIWLRSAVVRQYIPLKFRVTQSSYSVIHWLFIFSQPQCTFSISLLLWNNHISIKLSHLHEKLLHHLFFSNISP